MDTNPQAYADGVANMMLIILGIWAAKMLLVVGLPVIATGALLHHYKVGWIWNAFGTTLTAVFLFWKFFPGGMFVR